MAGAVGPLTEWDNRLPLKGPFSGGIRHVAGAAFCSRKDQETSSALCDTFVRRTFQNRSDDRESLSGLQLRSKRDHLAMFREVVVVQLAEHEHLRSPVLRVRRAFFEAQQREARGRQGQTSQAISPFLFRSSANDMADSENGRQSKGHSGSKTQPKSY